MDSQRSEVINGKKIEEFYWNGKAIVYVDNQKSELTFEEAVKKLKEGG